MPQRSGFVGGGVADGVNVTGVIGGNGAGVNVRFDHAHGGKGVALWAGVEVADEASMPNVGGGCGAARWGLESAD